MSLRGSAFTGLQQARLPHQPALEHEVRARAGAAHGMADAVLEVGMLLVEAVGGDQRKAGGPPIKRAVGNLLSSIWHRVTRDDMNEATMHQIAEILDEAAQKIERLK